MIQKKSPYQTSDQSSGHVGGEVGLLFDVNVLLVPVDVRQLDGVEVADLAVVTLPLVVLSVDRRRAGGLAPFKTSNLIN